MSERMVCLFTEKEKNLSLDSIYYNDIALCCVNSLTIPLNIVASGLVVYKYYQRRAHQPVSNTSLVILACLDLIKSSVGQPLYTSMYILEFFGIFHCTLQSITETIICVFLGFSFIMATLVLTSERLFAIVYPIYHRVYLRKKMLVYGSLALFIVWAILLTTFHIIVPRITQLYHIYVSILSAGLLYTLAVYVKIFCVSRKSTIRRDDKARSRNTSLRIDSEGTDMGPSGTPCQKIANKTYNLTAKEKKTVVRILLIIGVLYVTSMPLLATFLYAVSRGRHRLFVNYLYPWSTTLFFTSGVINPYVYCYRNEHFRIRKPTSSNVPVWSSENASSLPRRSQQNSTEEGR